MQRSGGRLVLSLFVASAVGDASSPILKVVELLNQLKTGIEADGKAEGASYDKFACYCENTLAEKAAAISAAKEKISELQVNINKLGGAVASYGVEIKQLEKDIAKNEESQKEAEEMREKEKTEYVDGKLESEQCIGALEAAIRVLTGAGTGASSKFLETMQETKLLSVAGGLRTIVKRASGKVSDDDLALMGKFVDHPEEFVGAASSATFAGAQVANNPFGDYAPKSGQVQGVLKTLYESFTLDLEKANAEESQKNKAFQELMSTKKAEHATLTTTLTMQKTAEADGEKEHADSKTERDDTAEQLEADERFFASLKANCKEKAEQWAERTRLRTEELHGIHRATEILGSKEAQATFKNATTTFVQLGLVKPHHAGKNVRAKAYENLKMLATRFQSTALARVAVQVKVGGHFNKVIAVIDRLITELQQEEKDDVKHRDRCIDKARKNKNELEDIEYGLTKVGETISRLEDEEREKVEGLEKLGDTINATNEEIAELKGSRGDEHDAALQANKDDREAIALLGQAIVELSRFYKDNPASLLQREDPPAEATEQAPETSFQSGAYTGRHGESGGIVAILEMIKQDLEKEIGVSSAADAAAQKSYEADLSALEETLDASTKAKNAMNEELIRLRVKLEGKKQDETQLGEDKDAKLEQKAGIETDCAWVETHFDDRLMKRRNEIRGLKDAKHLLLGQPVD